MSSGSRIPSLDGMRALAVMIVFTSHASYFGMNNAEFGMAMSESGFKVPARLGVTIFFFLSGYIITTLMRSEFERTGGVSLRNFYLRRIYRIFPPLYTSLAVAALLTWFGLLKDSVTLEAVSAQALHLTNYYALLGSRYNFFEGTALLWSLAVEEHFYLFFPLLFILLARRMTYKKLAFSLLGLCAAVLAWRFVLYYVLGAQGSWTLVATDARIDSILYGCVMGVWFNPAKDKPLLKSAGLSIVLLVMGIAALVFSIYYKDPAFKRTIMFSIQGIALMPVFACAIRHPDWLVFRWLNWPPVAALGLVSYTVYLMHAIALKTFENLVDSFWVGISLSFLVTIAFSTCMYLFIEKPLQKKRSALNKAANS
jgi:peptidoglycan/LPS O-acetylase OafA/YrhL